MTSKPEYSLPSAVLPVPSLEWGRVAGVEKEPSDRH